MSGFLPQSIVTAVLLVVCSQQLRAQDGERALDVQERESVEVRLLLVDVIAMDQRDRTVPDLTIDDFEGLVRGAWRRPDTLDVSCPGGAAEDPRAVRRASLREPPPAPSAPRVIVFVLDYMHLSPIDRTAVLEQVQEMVEHGGAADEEIMVAAIAGGLRIEQPFTDDRTETIDALRRMEYDVTLSARHFRHSHDLGFFDALGALLDVMERKPGPKAMVLFSNIPGMADEYDPQFARVAALAATTRTSIYPVFADGMQTPPPT